MVALENIGIAFAGEDLFSQISLQINPRDKIGLVGRNGSGKSTLFHLITGELTPSQGRITRPAGLRIGHLHQHIARSDTQSVLEETCTAFRELQAIESRIETLTHQLDDPGPGARAERLASDLAELTERYNILGGGTARAEAQRTLLGLGFTPKDLSRPTAQLSGGWRMRIELAKILLQKPDLLLLDEPTNHLDIESIQWLEDYLRTFPGALILVSHDRRFLDNITQRTVELTLGRAYSMNLPYTPFTVQRQEQREQQIAAYKNQQRLIEKTEEFIRRFRYKPEKSNQVQSRIKQLEKLERIEIDQVDSSTMSIRFPPSPRAGDTVVDAKRIAKRFGEKVVLEDASLTIARGEKVAFVGKNGEGKTTMARILQGELPYEAGTLRIGHNVDIGYFAQNQEDVLDPSKTVFQTIDEVATGSIRPKIRDLLGAFLFRGDDVDKYVRVLSGGERNRLAMVKLMLHPHNLLILDEPTNHLDIQAKDLLKDALKKYDGTLIIVSHDRDFLDGLAGKLYEFTQGRIREHHGGVNAFLEEKRLENLHQLDAPSLPSEAPAANSVPKEKTTRASWKEQKQRENDIRRREREIERLEDEISAGELRIKEMENQLEQPDQMGNQEDFFRQYQEEKHRISQLLKTWEERHYELDIIREQ